MNFINKLFGSSKIQEEFQKSIALNIPLIIYSIDRIEFTIKNNQLSKRNCPTAMVFDFSTNQLIIQGDFFNEIINGNHFIIMRIENINDTPEFFISQTGFSDVIVMKCIVYRKYILFQGTLKNWSFKVFDDFKISH